MSNISNNRDVSCDIMKKIEEYFPLKKPRYEDSMRLKKNTGMIVSFNLWYGEYQVLLLQGSGSVTNFSGSSVDSFSVKEDLSFNALNNLISLLKEQYHLYHFIVSKEKILLDFAVTANHEEQFGCSSSFMTKEQLVFLFGQLNEGELRTLLKDLHFERLVQIYQGWKKEYENPLMRKLMVKQSNSLCEKNEKS